MQFVEALMPSPFNLLHEAWIPVALSDGRRVFVRPCDISELRDGQPIVRVATGRPDCDISLTEFLIGILAVTTGPESTKDWLERYRKPPSRGELEKAFAPLEPAMMLDGPGPRFFQDASIANGRTWSCSNLFCDAPGEKTTDENADHFVKRDRFTKLSRSGAAIALLTLQSVAPSGGSGQYTALRGPGPLTTLVIPGCSSAPDPTLWQVIWANTPGGYIVAPEAVLKIFSWMSPTRTAATSGTTTADNFHKSHCFFGAPRRIALNFVEGESPGLCDLLSIFDSTFLQTFDMKSGGVDYEGWAAIHPLSPVWRTGPTHEFRTVQLRSSRVGYRQWLGMVANTANEFNRPANAVYEFFRRSEDLNDCERRSSRLLASGYKFKPGQATALDFGEALLPLIVTGSEGGDEIVRGCAKQWITAAELIASQLVSSVKRALYGQRGNADPGSTVLDPVRDRFWGETEQAFYAELRILADAVEQRRDDLVDHIDGLRTASGERWRAALHMAALQLFDATVSIEDAESHRIGDVIEGRKNLLRSLTGFGPVGAKVFEALALPAAEPKKKATRKGRST